MTFVTIAGVDKTACKTGDVRITYPDGRQVMHGQLSWALGAALQNNLPAATWSAILHEMTQLIRQQQLNLDVTFHGQPTAPLHR